jgi:hypothetical protein
MNCTGPRGTCRGVIEVDPPGDLKLEAPKRDVQCFGLCVGGGAKVKGKFRVAGASVASLDQDARAGKRFTFVLRKFCIVNGRRVPAGRGALTVAYGPTGRLDRSGSDLNGDGKPDRKPAKKRAR